MGSICKSCIKLKSCKYPKSELTIQCDEFEGQLLKNKVIKKRKRTKIKDLEESFYE